MSLSVQPVSPLLLLCFDHELSSLYRTSFRDIAGPHARKIVGGIGKQL
jgi:hypothetical protein